MKLLLLGANGQVGHELLRALAPLGQVAATTRSGILPDGSACEVAGFDQPDSLAVLLQRIRPDVVVNAAAYTAVDRAEEDRDAAWRANAEAPCVLARWCAQASVPLVHYSTDYVFDGQGKRAYREEDITSPLGVYGASKLAGEQAIRAGGARHLILRTAWVVSPHGTNFIKTMLRLAQTRPEVRVVDDQRGCPTSASDIAQALLTITQQLVSDPQAPAGTYHFVNAGEATWCDFARAIFEIAAEHGCPAPSVEGITTADYPTPARRPANSRLDTAKLAHDYAISPRPWREAVDEIVVTLLAAQKE